MNCHASSRLYVRANGTVPCNCDTGETTLLFRPDLDDFGSFDYVEDCFNGEPFVQMRTRLLASEQPIEACESCFFYRPSEPFLKYGESGRLQNIEHVQIESSFLCALDCDACVVRSTRTNPALSALGDGPYEMPLELFKKLIDDICRAGVTVGEMAFCGRGEPLLHPEFTEMIRHARARLPETFFSVVSSGNVPYCDGILDIDHLELSIDGAFADSYEVYRQGGKLDRVLKLVERISAKRTPDAEGGRGKPTLCWRYILFEHNDSEKEIVRAQELAHELGVDQMMFVLTHTWNRSKRYTSQAQIDERPEFKIFDGTRRSFSNVNEDSDNIAHWDEIGDTPRSQRFQE